MKKNWIEKRIILPIFILNIFFVYPKVFGAERPLIPRLNLPTPSESTDPYLSSPLFNSPRQRVIPPAALPQPSQSSSANTDPFLITPPAATRPRPSLPSSQEDPYLTGEERAHETPLDALSSQRSSIRSTLNALPERTPRTARTTRTPALEIEIDQLRSALEDCLAENDHLRSALEDCLAEKAQLQKELLKLKNESSSPIDHGR